MERLRTMTSDSEWLDIAQAAALLRVSEASLRRWTNGGGPPPPPPRGGAGGGGPGGAPVGGSWGGGGAGAAGGPPLPLLLRGARPPGPGGRLRPGPRVRGRVREAVAALSGGHGVPIRRAQPLRPGNGPVSPASSGPVPSPHRPVRELTRRRSFPVVCLLQPLDIDLFHLQHGLHDPVCFLGILVAEHLAEHG